MNQGARQRIRKEIIKGATTKLPNYYFFNRDENKKTLMEQMKQKQIQKQLEEKHNENH